MKKYIKPQIKPHVIDMGALLQTMSELHNEEGSGIQRSKGIMGFEEDEEEYDDYSKKLRRGWY